VKPGRLSQYMSMAKLLPEPPAVCVGNGRPFTYTPAVAPVDQSITNEGHYVYLLSLGTNGDLCIRLLRER
jgi:hypothetical protein